jgi:hypothetical protein
MADFLKAKEVTVTSRDGEELVYTISRFPAVAGREIVANYPLTAIPKASDYGANEAIMLKLMCYVGKQIGDNVVPLKTKALVDNHVPDFETLVKLEIEMMRYNTSFFQDGVASTFLSGIVRKALASATPQLTILLQPLLERIKQRSTN